MSATDFGIIGEFIKAEVKAASDRIISEKLEPICVLSKYADKDTLTLAEVVAVLRLRNEEQAREACQRGELPFVKIGRDYLFPKVQIVNFLLGRWQKQEEEKPRKTSGKIGVANIEDFVN